MIRTVRRVPALALSLAVTACSPLLMFNAVMPKDGGVRVATRDVAYGLDKRQRLDVYVPSTPAIGPRPLIVFFYGGSWSSGVKNGYGFVGRALAARGFVVAIPDYRLVPQVRFPGFLEDNAAAVHWLRAHAAQYGADPDRVVLAGHSAGAYNAAMLSLDPQWLGPDRKAIRGLIGLAGPYDFLPLDGPVVQAAFGNVPDPAITQPIRFVGPDAPPALLVTGDKDRTVLPRNSDSLAAKLGAAGVRVERVNFAKVGHAGLVTAIAKPLRGNAPVLDAMASFAQQVTRD